jgi:hypothetical protein
VEVKVVEVDEVDEDEDMMNFRCMSFSLAKFGIRRLN